MDEHMGRRTVGGLLFTKGGSILLFREDSSRHKANNCCSRHGCSSRHSVDKGKGKEPHRAAVPNESTPATPRRSQIFKNPNRKPPQPHESTAASDSVVREGTSSGSETGNRSRDTPGRDLLARLKERVNASRKRSLARENSPSSSSSLSSSSSNGLSASSSPSSRSISRPSHRAASRIRKADEGPSAGSDRARRNGNRDARRNSERSDDDMLLVEQITRDHEPAGEVFLSGFMARYRSGLQGALSSLDDGMEDSNGYWSFDMGGTEELENYFIFNDRHRGMRMDIDGMSYEELLALGERIGTVSTGLSDDALSKCLSRSLYMPTTSSYHEDCDKKCSICQEEYLDGDEVGKMACKHYYHISCIQHWLHQKNWCPICKSIALKTN